MLDASWRLSIDMSIPLSILDLAIIRPNSTAAVAFKESVEVAQRAEQLGYKGVWYAEHHNMPTIASSATSVLMCHVANHTSTIQVGAGGIMLPNHSPLVIAEQFGTLEELFPGRINLGLGRAPGSDQATFRALRRDFAAADSFPHDVVELQGYLEGDSVIKGVDATPGKGTNVPLTILGSSLFGAQLAAQLGLPYSFASHFAPDALMQAVEVYKQQFKPSDVLQEPYVSAGINIIAADTDEQAFQILEKTKRQRIRQMLERGRTQPFTEDELDMVMESPAGQQVLRMLTYLAAGTGQRVKDYLEQFVETTGVNELVTVHSAVNHEDRLRSLEVTAAAMGLTQPVSA